MSGVSRFLKFLTASFLLSVAVQFYTLEWEAMKERAATDDLCHAVGNYLEIGAIRDAYENLQAGASRLGYRDACVSVVNQGRNFSTNCANPNENYNTTVCRAEANDGVYAQILYSRADFFGFPFLRIWLTLFLSLMALGIITKWAALILTRQISEELGRNIFGASHPSKSPFQKVISFSLEKLGILNVVRKQTEDFQEKLQQHEDTERLSAAHHAKIEAEAEKNLDYIRMVKQIRHDIRSPLSSLMTVRSELTADKEIEAALSYSISSIEKLIDRLGESPEQEAPRLAVAEVLLEETVGSLAIRFKRAKDIALSLNYDRESLSPIMVTPLDFGRVIENLLENAFDAARVGGKIFVQVLHDKSNCRIVVQDNGCGVPLHAREKLFSEGATFQKVGGGGQGLSFVKALVESWSGGVSFRALCPGSEFEIVLPLMQAGVTYVGRLQSSKVLVVDDNEAVPLDLEKRGFEVIDAAVNLVEGRRLFEAHRKSGLPVLVDEALGNGSHGTDLIREFGATENVYLCTNDYDNPEVVRRARAVGVRIFPKPLFRSLDATTLLAEAGHI